MDSFEWNKIFGALLVALLIAMVAIIVGDGLVSPKMLEKNVFVIDAPDDASPASGAGDDDKVDPVAPLLAKADSSNGEKLSTKLCGQCHTFKQGEPHKTGPNLFGIVGKGFAHAADYAYSTVFKDKQGKDTWDEEKLNIYLHKPRAYMKGTKMAFAGIRKAEERADVIKFLDTMK